MRLVTVCGYEAGDFLMLVAVGRREGLNGGFGECSTLKLRGGYGDPPLEMCDKRMQIVEF